MTNLTTNGSDDSTTKVETQPELKVWLAREPPFEGYVEPQTGDWEKSKQLASSGEPPAIVIDNGSCTVRAGWSYNKDPLLTLPPVVSRYRDRKLGRTYTFAGSNAYVDATTRGQIRSAFEAGTGIVSNWDVMEGVLDFIFLKMGVDGAEGGVDRPIVMTEPVANLPYARKTMSEIMFECYQAPSLAYGVDCLFSYDYNGGKTGLVISSSHSSTHLIPVIDHRALLTQATRLNWGGSHSAEYLLKLLQLKYPNFPGKITSSQAEDLVREHCYVSESYPTEVSSYLDWTGLEERSHIIQYPYTEPIIVVKTQEELERAAEKRKESGRRLQAQAAKIRLEKLVRKEQELEYYRNLQAKSSTESKKEFRRLLESNDFENEAQLERTVRDLDRTIRKARTRDIGGDGEPEDATPDEPLTFPLLDIPDADLSESSLRSKRQQRLQKANHDARARAKAAKEENAARLAEEARLDLERRTTNLPDWLSDRHTTRDALLQKLKLRQRLRTDLTNRKSLASQMRMKAIAGLASDNPARKRRRPDPNDPRGTRINPDRDDNDTFGADDDDWGVYRTLGTQDGITNGITNGGGGGGGAGSDGDDPDNANTSNDPDEDLHTQLLALEADLLQHDPAFTSDDTHAALTSWTRSLVHAFTRGARAYDADSARETHQLHLNVERIRVPEVVFQPSIAGLDQAGLVEIAGQVLTMGWLGSTTSTSTSTTAATATATGGDGRAAAAGTARDEMLRDVFLTGGATRFRGFEERLRLELRAVVPVGADLRVRSARDAMGDAWRGAARWAGDGRACQARVTRKEWEECGGGGYLKEHGMGNVWGGAGGGAI